MAIYKVKILASNLDDVESVTYEFCKLGQIIYNGHHRDVYVSAANREIAKKKALKLIRRNEELEDEPNTIPKTDRETDS